MASIISKRQQARNERQLQDLLKSTPGNDRCADCATKNPTWASWNLGLFLCERCGGLHRKLGTHVSKVKSLSMDSWSADQVEHMKKVGNLEGNRRWNPKGVRPDIPIDVDEVDGAVERFIRAKYEQRAFMAGGGGQTQRAAVRQDTWSTETGSWSEEPPPLPPKPGKRFGFSLRSASSNFPRASKHEQRERNFTPPMSPTYSGNDAFEPPSPQGKKARNKPSQMFGMKITGVGNNFDAKLATLRDMGFSDNRRNSDVLKSANGNLDSAIETLVRQAGEAQVTPGPRTLTPVSMASQGPAGITIDKTRQPKANNNPWEIVEQAPQRAATHPVPEQPRSQSVQPQSTSWNPFLQQAQPQQQAQQQLVDGLQNMQMSQTGPAAQQYAQSNLYGQQGQNGQYQTMQAANPWGASNSQQQPQPSAIDQTYGQQYQQLQQYQQPAQPLQPQQTSNPFLRRAASQTFAPSNPWGQASTQPQVAPSSQQLTNPFGLPPLRQQQNTMQQPATQAAFSMYSGQQQFTEQQTQPAQHQSPWPAQGQLQPQQQMMMPQQTGMQAQPQLQQQQQPQWQQQPPPQQPQQQAEQPWQYHEVKPLPQPRMQLDKSSILGLYNMQSAMSPQQQHGQGLQSIAENGGMQNQQQQQQQQYGQMQARQAFQPQQRSATMPMGFERQQQQLQQNSNPWATTQHQQQQQQEQQAAMSGYAGQAGFGGAVHSGGSRHVSHESAAFVGFGQAGASGRESPDAFAGLASSYAR
ncbi:hypothetical protein LTR62_008636 [Meristemomyces frigidus]|uniref:ArfGap-domain-containing protein n=1 Tax=Meristemomyces frigidus TaxID=1508187 RepID=A0AAN7T9S9_9PEZI|nr:hypothetical protein LTR62_008636 [Meristemomyces frigidus]